jgi:hypothetical protein
MATTLNRSPVCVDITLSRGDTQTFDFTILDSDGSAANLAGYTFLFTVDPSPAPTDNTNNVVQVVPSFSGNVVTVTMDATDTDRVGTLYYDLESTVSGAIFTEVKGKIAWEQDITKGTNP